jgi:hypothetical protein
MSWAFYLFAVGYFGTGPAFGYWAHILSPPAYLVLSFVLSTIFGAWSVLPLLPFVLRFPDGDVLGWRRRVDPFVWAFLVLSYVVYVVEWREYSVAQSVPAWDVIPGAVIPLTAFALAGLVLAKNLAIATPSDRQRWGFLAIGTIASFVAYAIYFVPGVPFAVGQIVGFGVVLMPICIAYAVFRLRVLDVNFVLNRALVYGVLSLGVIAFVSILDWFFSRVVAIGRLAIGLELLATIVIGFLLDRINRGVERVVEALFFRQRRIAERHLRRAASALPYATDEAAIADGLVQVPADALELAAAALYRESAGGSRFEGLATSRETQVAPASFDANHLLVRMLLADEKIVWLDDLRSQLDVENAAIYTLAVPVTVRHELVCFTLYGAHTNGAQLDPDEVELLEELAREASRAYDHVEAVRVRERYAGRTLEAGDNRRDDSGRRIDGADESGDARVAGSLGVDAPRLHLPANSVDRVRFGVGNVQPAVALRREDGVVKLRTHEKTRDRLRVLPGVVHEDDLGVGLRYQQHVPARRNRKRVRIREIQRYGVACRNVDGLRVAFEYRLHRGRLASQDDAHEGWTVVDAARRQRRIGCGDERLSVGECKVVVAAAVFG